MPVIFLQVSRVYPEGPTLVTGETSRLGRICRESPDQSGKAALCKKLPFWLLWGREEIIFNLNNVHILDGMLSIQVNLHLFLPAPLFSALLRRLPLPSGEFCKAAEREIVGFLSSLTLTACFNIYVSAIFTPRRLQLCTVSLLTGNFSHPSDFWSRSSFPVF